MEDDQSFNDESVEQDLSNSGSERKQSDNDFEYNKPEEGEEGEGAEDPKKVDNQHFDEAYELSEDQEDSLQSNDQDKDEAQDYVGDLEDNENAENIENNLEDNQDQDAPKTGFAQMGGKEDLEIPGMYKAKDYENLPVDKETKDLFEYITRFKPITQDLETKLKAFIPEYIPAVGEVDAFLKIPKPDNTNETLGLMDLDEPKLNQSKKAKLDLMFQDIHKKKNPQYQSKIHSIEEASKNPKEIASWIKDVSDNQKVQQAPTVAYTKTMPDIDSLMEEWPPEMEEALNNLHLPNEDIDLDLQSYSKLACTLLDIPVHNTKNNKNIIESLHVFFTLYSVFKENVYFQKQKQGEEENHQLDQPNVSPRDYE